jgi:Asp-tRNA(Asn)/Glu-tRNA(Gln) amidotransferase A subunit family amidase
MRLALSLDLGFYAINPQVEANTRAAAAALADAGAIVEDVDLSWSKELVDAWNAHWGVYLATFFGHKLAEYRDRMDPNVVALIEAGFAMDAVSFKRLEFLRTDQWRKLSPILQRYDALLCPTMAHPAPPVGGKDADFDRMDEKSGRYHGLDMTSVFNLVSQCPALSVPSGFTADGLPTGLQIVGRRFDDLTPLRLAAALEAVRPWAGQRPPL